MTQRLRGRIEPRAKQNPRDKSADPPHNPVRFRAPLPEAKRCNKNKLRIQIALLAALAAFALPAAAQTPYTPPRTPCGQPSLEGVWTHNFIVLMESMSAAPLTLPEADAKVFGDRMGKAFGDALDRGLDSEVPELMRTSDGLPIVRGERRTRSVVMPADGKLPYTPEARREAMRDPPNPPSDNPE